MNTRLLTGIVAILLGLIILIWPALLAVVAGLALVAFGLWFALQGAGQGPAI